MLPPTPSLQANRIGGKGTVRRKKPAVHKASAVDDKRLQSTLKRLGVNNIPGIEEVNIFKEDGNVIHFENPKVQASIAANTYVVSGTAETKSVQELMPGIISQMGPNALKGLLESMAKGGKGVPGLEQMMGEMGGAGGDDEMPELETADFEAVSVGG